MIGVFIDETICRKVIVETMARALAEVCVDRPELAERAWQFELTTEAPTVVTRWHHDMTCPHGTKWWIQPDADTREWLRTKHVHFGDCDGNCR